MDDPKYSLNHLPDNTKLSTIREILNNATKEKAPMQSVNPEAPLTPEQMGASAPVDNTVNARNLANIFGLPSARDLATPTQSQLNANTPDLLRRVQDPRLNLAPDYGNPDTQKQLQDFYQQEDPKAQNKEESKDFISSLIKNYDNNTTKTPKQAQAKTEEVPVEASPSVSGTAGVSPRGSVQQKPSITEQSAPATIPTSLEDTEMKAALEQAQANREHAGFRSSLADLSNAIIGTGGADMSKNRVSSLDRDLANANMPLTDLSTQRDEYKKFLSNAEEKSAQDPNSEASKLYREGLKEMLPEGSALSEQLSKMSRSDMEKFFPVISASLSKKQQQAALAEQRADRVSQREIAGLDKKSARLESNVVKWDSEARNQPAYERFQKNQESYLFAEKLAKGELDPNGVDDAALILQGIKLAQADSTAVRESDQKLFSSVGGLAQNAQELQQKILGGGKLTPKVRKAYIDLILHMRNNLAKSAKEQTSHVYSKFKQAGVPEDAIPGTLRNLHSIAEPSSSGIKKVTLKDGNVINIKESDLSQIDKADIAKVE